MKRDNKIDVLFVEPNSAKQSYQGLADTYAAIETPTWSLLLAQSCRSKGFLVGILDANAERLTDNEALARINELAPRMVCFVVYGQNPNSGTVNMTGAYALSDKCHKEGYITVFVGSHTSALPKEVLANSCVDIVLLNEGVYALHNLLKSNLDSDLPNIKGIGFKSEDSSLVLNDPERIVPQNRMVEDLPGYAWDLLPYDKTPFDLYRAHFWHTNYSLEERSPFAAIYTSFGCNFKCDFCMINILNRTSNDNSAVSSDFNVMRYWPSEFIIKEFDILYKHYGVKNIRLSDEMFFLHKKHYLPIIELLEERKYPLNLWAYSRIDTCKSDMLTRFKGVGINWLGLGIEAANKTVRQEITKGKFKDVHIKSVVKEIKEAGINVGANYIFGFPGENLENLQETLDLAKEINAEFSNMYCAAALPGSPLYKEAVENGWDLPESISGYGFYSYDCKPLPTRHLTAEQVLRFRDNAWQEVVLDEKYLSLIESKFGHQARLNIVDQASLKLKRKLLGD
tara:strand:+ start:825 stop:2354 length:1530 start_codon:yes stop_codon:yes gene_type:complete